MPTYEYICTTGHAFDRFQRISDRPVTKCPECGAKAVRKISGGQGLIFKGSGFYITDYGKDGKGTRKDPTGDAAPVSESPKTSTPSEAAPAKGEAATPAKPAAPATKERPRRNKGDAA